MNLSLRDRVNLSFIITCLIVIILGLTHFHFLESLNKTIEKSISEANRVTVLTDSMRVSAVTILKYQRRLANSQPTLENIDKLNSLCDDFIKQLQTVDTYNLAIEVKQVISKIQSYVESMQVLIKRIYLNVAEKNSNFHNKQAINADIIAISEFADKILDSYSEFQDMQFVDSTTRDDRLNKFIKRIKRHMMYTLILTFIGTILFGLVIPGKIALPFKKITDAIRELQNCNFDVSIYYDREDEIGEMAQEINKMIVNFKRFEELRAEKIMIEGRKFDALANMIKKLVIVCNAKSEVVYMNKGFYSILQMQSEDVLGKNLRDTRLPDELVETFEVAIRRRSKVDNLEVNLLQEFIDKESNLLTDGQYLFKGFANIIPIRGKESSLDYYLMILSEELLV